jgi:NADPH:quinone reductase-like Zn-dependent oxidoreductase
LNFRDVMYAMGLLPDEALENGFAGQTLGMELSGVITRVGAGVVKFHPGDEVIVEVTVRDVDDGERQNLFELSEVRVDGSGLHAGVREDGGIARR